MSIDSVSRTRAQHEPPDLPRDEPRIRKMPLSEDFHSHRSDAELAKVSYDSAAFKVDIGNTTAFVHGASMDDVRQGFIGDCTVMASLMALARTPKGQAFLQSRITENYGSDGKVASYTVLLKQGALDLPVNVDAHKLEAGHFLGESKDGAREVWPLVYEDAFAKLYGGYDKIDEGSDVPTSFGLITGTPAVDSSPSAADFSAKLHADFAAGKAQILSTDDDEKKAPPGGWDTGTPKLTTSHAYVITDVRDVAMRGADDRYHLETLVTVRNPWGHDSPRPMTLGEVQKHFNAYSAGDVP